LTLQEQGNSRREEQADAVAPDGPMSASISPRLRISSPDDEGNPQYLPDHETLTVMRGRLRDLDVERKYFNGDGWTQRDELAGMVSGVPMCLQQCD